MMSPSRRMVTSPDLTSARIFHMFSDSNDPTQMTTPITSFLIRFMALHNVSS